MPVSRKPLPIQLKVCDIRPSVVEKGYICNIWNFSIQLGPLPNKVQFANWPVYMEKHCPLSETKREIIPRGRKSVLYAICGSLWQDHVPFLNVAIFKTGLYLGNSCSQSDYKVDISTSWVDRGPIWAIWGFVKQPSSIPKHGQYGNASASKPSRMPLYLTSMHTCISVQMCARENSILDREDQVVLLFHSHQYSKSCRSSHIGLGCG